MGCVTNLNKDAMMDYLAILDGFWDFCFLMEMLFLIPGVMPYAISPASWKHDYLVVLEFCGVGSWFSWSG